MPAGGLLVAPPLPPCFRGLALVCTLSAPSIPFITDTQVTALRLHLPLVVFSPSNLPHDCHSTRQGLWVPRYTYISTGVE